MTGLIYKDLLCLRKSVLSYGVVIAIYIVLSVMGVLDMSILAGVLALMVSLLPVSSFSFDQAAKWECYGLALPVSRTKTVAARYVVVLLMAAAGAALALLGGAVTVLLERGADWETYLVTLAVSLGLSILINAILLPLLYKFGAERARIALLGVLGAVMLVGGAFLGLAGGLEWLDSLPDPSPAMVAAAPFLVMAAGVALLALSFLISRWLYGRREM